MTYKKRLLVLILTMLVFSVSCTQNSSDTTARDKLMPMTRPWWNEGTDTNGESIPEDTYPQDITGESIYTPPEDVLPPQQGETQTDKENNTVRPPVSQRPSQNPSDVPNVPSDDVTSKEPEGTTAPETEAPSPLEGLEPLQMLDYAVSQLAGKNVMLTGAGSLKGDAFEDLSVLIVRGEASSILGTSSTMRLDMTGNGVDVHDYVYTTDGTNFYYSEDVMTAPVAMSKQEMLSKYGMMPDVILPYTFTKSNVLFSSSTEEGDTYRVKVTYNPIKLTQDYKNYISYICNSAGITFNNVVSVNIDFTLNYNGTFKSMSVVETYMATVNDVSCMCVSTVSYTFAAVNPQT